MSTRWECYAASEAATSEYLRSLGNETLELGIGQLSRRARQLMQEDQSWPPDLTRWTVDRMVKARTGELAYVDAKFALPGRRNWSVEIRSVMAARLATRPVWYVFSQMTDDGEFVNFRTMSSTYVHDWGMWGCCLTCAVLSRWDDIQEANKRLPKYCTERKVIGGSRTPYKLVKMDQPGWWQKNPFGIPLPPREYEAYSPWEIAHDAEVMEPTA